MKKHDWKYAEAPAYGDKSRLFGIRCVNCGSFVRATASSYGFRTHRDELAKFEIKKQLRQTADADFPKDCDEARDLNIVRQIHES